MVRWHLVHLPLTHSSCVHVSACVVCACLLMCVCVRARVRACVRALACVIMPGTLRLFQFYVSLHVCTIFNRNVCFPCEEQCSMCRRTEQTTQHLGTKRLKNKLVTILKFH